MELGKIKTKRFADGEIYVQIQVRVRALRHAACAVVPHRPGSFAGGR